MSLSCHGEASKSGHRIRLLYVSYLGVSDVEKVSGVMETSPVGLWVCQSDIGEGGKRREEWCVQERYWYIQLKIV